MKTISKFEELYRKLNKEQKEAVVTIEGPVMVVAGPGTGKTLVLTLRIAKILQEADIRPENILALTFTDAAAMEMKKRLADIMGSQAYRVAIFTFHRFCNEVIQDNPEDFPEIIGSINITEAEQVRIAQEIISTEDFQYLRPFGDIFYYVKPLLKVVSDLKREGIGAKLFRELVENQRAEFTKRVKKGINGLEVKYQRLEREIGKNRELVVFYERYQKALAKDKFYDYDDMILKVVEELSRNEDLLRSLQEQYHYILADEHQDVNNAQNKVLELLGSYDENPNIFMVGDEKQAIFRFQGASLENFLYFQRKYPKVKLIRLTQSYRSTQSILDAAGHLMAERGTLIAQKPRGEKVAIYALSKPDVELYFVARKIKELADKGTNPQEIAILYRDNKDAHPVIWMFRKLRIPFVLESDQDVLLDEYIRKLILIFEAVQNFGEERFLYEVLHIDFLGVEPLAIYKLGKIAAKNRKSLHDVVKSAKDTNELTKEEKAGLEVAYGKLSQWYKRSHKVSMTELFEEIVRDSGLLADLLSREDAYERMERLRRFFAEVQILESSHGTYTLGDFLSHLSVLKEHSISLQRIGEPLRSNAVRLMTAHKSKGREFDYVFIINAVDGHWGSRRGRRHFVLPQEAGFFASEVMRTEDEEERKLFYVALTRARKQVFISYSKDGVDGRGRLPSRFVEEIASELSEEVDVQSIEQDFLKNQTILFAPTEAQKASYEEKEFLQQLFYERGLSDTALNDYLECPWKYFYLDLVQIPKALLKQQLYGIAVHRVLNDFFQRYKRGKAAKDYLLSRFEYHLSRTALSGKEFELTLRKGENALSGYYDWYEQQWPKKFILEFTVRGVFLEAEETQEKVSNKKQTKPEIMPIRLTGKIDKVEIVESGKDMVTVNVVDFKTEKPKSRKWILGQTKNTRGGYWRQLVFYQLLLNSYRGGKYRMVSGEFDFIEPDIKGGYRKEQFIVESGHVQELEQLIRKVAKEIVNLEFWDKTCGRRSCEFCDLRSYVRSNTSRVSPPVLGLTKPQ